MRVLVTGADGFVGRHLMAELSAHGHTPVASDVSFKPGLPADIERHSVDITDCDAVERMVATAKPDACVHLAGISFVPAGNADPSKLFTVNIIGTVRVLDAFRKHSPSAGILAVSTAHVYGEAQRESLISEDDPVRPITLYATSKAAADLLCLAYARDFDMHVMTVRPTNHIGPGQSPTFVVASFAGQVKAVAGGQLTGPIKTGNLESRRDFLDVRDVVRAYRLLLEKGHRGTIYNLTSGRMFKLKDILDMLAKIAGISPEIVTDPSRYRPADSSPALDISRIKAHTGWKPEIPIEKTLRDILAES